MGRPTFYRPIGIAALVLGLAGCSYLSQVPAFFDSASTKIASAIDAFKTDVSAFAAGVQKVVAKLNTGAAAAGQDLQMVCGGISVMNGLYQAVAPLAGASAADNADEALGMASANALCNSPVKDVASAVSTGLGVYKTIKTATENVAPGATAPKS